MIFDEVGLDEIKMDEMCIILCVIMLSRWPAGMRVTVGGRFFANHALAYDRRASVRTARNTQQTLNLGKQF